MRNKLFDHLLQLSNVSFIFGIVLTIILIHLKSSNGDYSYLLQNWALLYLPYTIFLIISLVSATCFALYRKNYFILIDQHITKKCISIYKWSVYMLFINIFISILMLYISAATLLSSNTSFFVNGYLYIVLAIEMILTLFDVVLDSISKLKVKLDLSLRRGGSDQMLSKDYVNEKLESNSVTEN